MTLDRHPTTCQAQSLVSFLSASGRLRIDLRPMRYDRNLWIAHSAADG
jgi:hypothetical protein